MRTFTNGYLLAYEYMMMSADRRPERGSEQDKAEPLQERTKASRSSSALSEDTAYHREYYGRHRISVWRAPKGGSRYGSF